MPPYGPAPAGRGPGTGNNALIFVLVGVLVAVVAGVGIFFAFGRSTGGGASSSQLTSRQLAAALLPASAFGSGYTAEAPQLGTAPNASADKDVTCMVMLGDIDISNSVSSAMDPGASAQAADLDFKLDPGTGTGVFFAQSVEQFPDATQAAALMGRMAPLLVDCGRDSVGIEGVALVSTNLGMGDQSVEVESTGLNPMTKVAVDSKVIVVREGRDIYEATLLFGAHVGAPGSPALTTVVDDLAANVRKG
jgi:hypothetical protein